MPVAVAAPSLPVSSIPSQAAADGASSLIASADFASLLLDQLGSETAFSKLAIGEESTLALPAETTSAPLDPALLLASMGITAFPPLPARTVETGGEPPVDAGTSGLSELGAALPQLPGIAQLPAQAGDRIGTEAATAQISNSPPPAQFMTAVQTGTPAKLAGFEQKLADTVQGLTETEVAPSPQQLANAAQPGNNAATNLHHTNEGARIETPLRDQAWPAEFGQKVVWLATQDKQSAQITLNPPQLGPIEISLSVKSDQVTAVFASANAEVREAIESALPRLREMLAGVGVELGQTNVSAESFRQPGDNGNNNRSNAGGNGNNGANRGAGAAIRSEALMMGGATIKRGNGLVDTFA